MLTVTFIPPPPLFFIPPSKQIALLCLVSSFLSTVSATCKQRVFRFSFSLSPGSSSPFHCLPPIGILPVKLSSSSPSSLLPPAPCPFLGERLAYQLAFLSIVCGGWMTAGRRRRRRPFLFSLPRAVWGERNMVGQNRSVPIGSRFRGEFLGGGRPAACV